MRHQYKVENDKMDETAKLFWGEILGDKPILNFKVS